MKRHERATTLVADAMVGEFQRRGVPAFVSRGMNETTCHATINNLDVAIHFPAEPTHGDIVWQGNDGQDHRVRDLAIAADDLAEMVIETLVNPA